MSTATGMMSTISTRMARTHHPASRTRICTGTRAWCTGTRTIPICTTATATRIEATKALRSEIRKR